MTETSRFLWEPSPEFIANTNVYRFMRRLGIATHDEFIRYSQEHLEEFWDKMVRELGIEWFAVWSGRAGSPAAARATVWRSFGKAKTAAFVL